MGNKEKRINTFYINSLLVYNVKVSLIGHTEIRQFMWGILLVKGNHWTCQKKAKELSAIAVSKLKTKGRYALGGIDSLHLFVIGNSRAWVLRVAVGIRTNTRLRISW